MLHASSHLGLAERRSRLRGPEGLSSDPLVTVVTPTLERRERLAHTLKSVAVQTYPNIEHIVVDGGSTDGTRQMLEEWEREQGVRWISEPDEGIYHAVNKGFDMANGTVFCYLNSDDLFFPWSVAVAVDALQNADLVYGDAIILRETEGLLQFAVTHPSVSHRPKLYAVRQPAAFWTRPLHQALAGFRLSLIHISEPTRLRRISYAVFCLKKKKK